MEFRVLGPVEVWRDGQRLELGTRQLRFVLAVLLLAADRVVPTARLTELLWPEEQPRSARHAVQVRISQLRTALGPDTPVVSDGDGYRLDVDPDSVDVHLFRSRVVRARAAADRGAYDEAATTYRSALTLWRGDALSGAASGEVRERLCHGLEEARAVALEDCLDAELRLGRHTRVLDELTALVRTHPTRERLVRQLMLALYRSGQTAGALETARQTREQLVEQLGVDPGSELQALELAILREDPALSLPDPAEPAVRTEPAPVVPAQLPAAAAGFTGRSAQLARLDDLLAQAEASADESRLVVLSGMGGVGKTALATLWARRVAQRFPDGQLYLDLRGYAAGPAVRPVDALAHLLRGLGVEPDAIPTEPDAAAAAYRTRLADRSVLVVLDNAADAEQVRPLLPGGPGCLTLVTSRDRLSGLVARDGASRLDLDSLAADEATELLESLLGPARAAAEADAVAGLAGLCGRLPLALRIAAGYLLDSPELTVASYVGELRAGDLLDELAVDGDDDAAVRATFDLSYQRLAEPDRRLFRLLSVIPGPDFTVEAAAALAGLPVGEARRRVRRLAAHHLVTEPAPGRFAFHDLLCQYAISRAEADETPDACAEGLNRLMAWYYVNSRAAADRLFNATTRLPAPPLPVGLLLVVEDEDTAVRWYEDERPNLLAAILHSANTLRIWCWQLTDLVRQHLHIRGLHLELLTCAAAAVRAAEATDDPRVLASVHMAMANGFAFVDDYAKALPQYDTALEYASSSGDLGRVGAILNNVGLVYLKTGRLRTAQNYFVRCLAAKQKSGQAVSEATALGNLGVVCSAIGELRQGLDYLRRALEIHERLAVNSEMAFVLNQLANLTRRLGRPRESLELVARAEQLAHEFGNGRIQVDSPIERAMTYVELGRLGEARADAERAITAAENHGDPLFVAGARLVCADVHRRLGDLTRALGEYRTVVELSRSRPTSGAQIEGLVGIATTLCLQGDGEAALEHVDRAVSMARARDMAVALGDALTVRSQVELALGRTREAVTDAEHALAVHRETGHHLGTARALTALAHALREEGGERAEERAATCLREAYDLFASFGAPEAQIIAGLLDGDVPAHRRR